MQKKRNLTKQLCINAIMIALFVLLDQYALRMGNYMKITFSGLPIIISAVYYGPVSGATVGLIGALLGQLLSGYGFTPTTILWILPAGVRGLMVGLFAVCLKKKNILQEMKVWKIKFYPILTAVIILSSLVVTALNRVALYVDSKMFGYYSDQLIFGMLVWVILQSIITAILYSIIVPMLLIPLNKVVGK